MIDRRNFVRYGSASLIGTLLLNSCRDTNRNVVDNHPNIIILIADDLRWDCLGFYNQLIQTPHLDRLASQGIIYQNNFVTTSICPTSRASIFTGLYARSHGIWDFETALTENQWQNTYFHWLKQAGYTTGFVGKWGLGGNLPEKEFDYWAGFEGQGNYYTETRKEHLTSYLTSQVEDFLSDRASPFCLTLSHKAPHVDEDPDNPFVPDPKFARQYQNVVIPRYQQPNDWRSLPEFLQNTEAQLRYQQRFQTEELYQKSVKNYYRLISGIDESIGRIVQKIKKQNFTQDTYIIFTSDNGFFLGEKGLAGKWFGFEPAIRTPLIISCINKPQPTPQTISNMTLNIDLAPTVIALGQVEPETNLFHGVDLAIEAQSQPKPRQWWFYEHLFEHPQIQIPKNVGIRSLDYKYLFFPEYDYEMLFDPTFRRFLNRGNNIFDRLNQESAKCVVVNRST